MKQILYVSSHNPFSYNFGADQRASVLMKALLANGHHVDLIMLGMPQQEPEQVPVNVNVLYWKTEDIDERPSFFSRYFMRFVRWKHDVKDNIQSEIIQRFLLRKEYDAVVARYIPFATSMGLDSCADKLYLDVDDLPSMAYETMFEGRSGFLSRLKLSCFLSMKRRNERYWLSHAKHCFIPSAAQAEQFGITYLPNIPVVHSDGASYTGSNKTFLFVGILGYEPNYQGVDHFITHIWPAIKENHTDAIFRVAGKNLNAELQQKWSKIDGVQLLGFVDSIEEFYASGDYVVCPIYAGAGTNIKVLEAMAMGKVCIMSQFASKGFESLIINHKNAYVAESDEEYIDLIEKAVSDKNKSKEMAEAAFKDCNMQYSQESINKIIGNIIN